MANTRPPLENFRFTNSDMPKTNGTPKTGGWDKSFEILNKYFKDPVGDGL